jgi:DNA ligase-1
MSFEPMLAATCKDITKLRYPVYVSDKEDGIRCCIITSPRTQSRLVASRTLKPIPNLHIRHTIHKSALPVGVDGELMVGNNFQDVASGVMSVGGEPKFTYKVFDYFGCGTEIPFQNRIDELWKVCADLHYLWLQVVPQQLCHTPECVQGCLDSALARGKEGVMLRSPAGIYKFGRSTIQQQGLLKLKPYEDSDARVVGFEELIRKDEITKGNTLGALVVRDDRFPGITFNIGTGFSEEERKRIWLDQPCLAGKWISYKYQSMGTKNAPRTPVFLRWRTDKEV